MLCNVCQNCQRFYIARIESLALFGLETLWIIMIFCEHCNEYVSRSAYYRHRRLRSNQSRTSFTTNSQDITNIDFNDDLLSETQESSNHCVTDASSLNAPMDQTSSFSETEDCSDFHSSEGDDDSNESAMEDNAQSTCEDNDQPEIWEDVSFDQIMSDVQANSEIPCPEPSQNQNNLQKATSLLKWMVYFLLLWQSFCKVSDNGLEWLLQFHSQFFKSLASICGNAFLKELAVAFPSSLYLLRKFVCLDRDTFKKYAVCSKCSKLYDMEECTERDRNGNRKVKYCQNKKFPKSKICGAPLAKKVFLANGNRYEFYPLKIYCYNSIINNLENMLKRKGFPEDCEKWRDLQRQDGYLSDIIDGKVWKEFKNQSGDKFLSKPRHYMFMLNFDFFQPLKHRNDYSVGVLYLANLNLPRHLRFKWENIIVAGIIPGLENGSVDLNEFLAPLVKEMKCLWSGLYLKTSLSNIPLKFKAALACISCDIPAARKLCGFKNHNANYGCSKCFKFFPGNVKDSFDYSGFERNEWPKRRMDKHRRNAKRLRQARSKAQYMKLSKKFGMYYSPLVELEYFDLIRCIVVDPMHNLFLGTAKSMFKIWTENDILSKKDIKVVESRIKSFDVGTGLGRLPHNISANYGCYTASQWKNWTLIYSMYVLNGLLPIEDLQCWQAYVLACKFLTRPVISSVDLEKADMMLMNFCKKFERLYGKDCVKPNMHLHGHLKECVEDFGPVYNFWCFSFERYNGILSSFKTNNRCIEVQLMRRIISDNFIASVTPPSEFEDVFLKSFQRDAASNLTCYTELEMQLTDASLTSDIKGISWGVFEKSVTLPKCYRLKTLDDDDLSTLSSMYHNLYHDEATEGLQLSQTVREYSHVLIGSEKFGSRREGRSVKSSRIIASWTDSFGEICSTYSLRPGVIHHFIQHNAMINGQLTKHTLAVIDWFEEDERKDAYGRPVEVWKSTTVDGGPSKFLPVARIYGNYVIADSTKDTFVLVPLNRTFSS